MRKFAALLLTSAFLFAFTACGNNSAAPDRESSEALSESRSESSPESAAGEPFKSELSADVNYNAVTENGDLRVVYKGEYNALNTGYCNSAATEQGFYRFNDRLVPQPMEYFLLTYFDYATKQETVVCADSSCKHDNEHCNAVFKYSEFLDESHLFIYGDYLYCLCVNNYNDGEFGTYSQDVDDRSEGAYVEKRKQSLYRMNPDGTNREKLFDFDEGLAVEKFVVGDGESLWFITKEPYLYELDGGRRYTSCKNRALVKYSLKDKSFTMRIPLDEKDNVRLIPVGVYKNKFIFSGTAYPDGKSEHEFIEYFSPDPEHMNDPGYYEERQAKTKEIYDNSRSIIYALDSVNTSCNEIYRGKHNYCITEGDLPIKDNLLYITKSSDGVDLLDLDTGKAYAHPNYKQGNFMGIFGGREYYYLESENDEGFYFADPDSGGLTKISWFTDSFSFKYPILTAVNSKQALVIFDSKGEENADGSISNPQDIFGLIPLEDFFGGRDNIEPITLLKIDH